MSGPCPAAPLLDEDRPLLAALARLEAEAGHPVDAHRLGALLHLRSAWGAKWRQRLGRLLRQYEREGRLRRVEALPWRKGLTLAERAGGWTL